MIQTNSFWRRPYWQRLSIGAALLLPVVIMFFLQLLRAIVLETAGAFRVVARDAGCHLTHLAKFYRFDVLSPTPSKHVPKPDPDYWEAQ